MGWEMALIPVSVLNSPEIQPSHRRIRILSIALLLIIGSLFIPVIRHGMLRAAGRALIAEDRLEPADLIVVMSDTDGAGAIQASDLVRNGIASRVAVFADPPDPVVDREFMRRGLPYEDMAARETRQLRAAGVDNVHQIPKPTSEADNGPILADWCAQHGFRSVIVITNLSESRLVRRVFHRSLKSQHIKVLISSAPYGGFHPDAWWQSHDGIRTEIQSLENLFFDSVRHPVS